MVLTSFLTGAVPSLIGVALQWLVSAALFPLANRLMERQTEADLRFR
jgi:hypothetical protein